MASFAGLSEAQRERLEVLVEEAGEVVKAGTKILRHGYDSYNPDDPEAGNNERQLRKELLDLFTVAERMIAEHDIGQIDFNKSAEVWKRKQQYMHHQPPFHHPLDGVPRPPDGLTNAGREGWVFFFEGKSRVACPFPTAREDLWREYERGWDAAKAHQDGRR